MSSESLAAVVVALALYLAPGPARAAALLDAAFQGSTSSGPDLNNTPFTVGNGSDRLMIISVSTAGDVPVASASFRGVPATRVFTQTSVAAGPLCRTEIWRIVGPPSGTGFVAVSLTGMTSFGLGVVSYSGVDQSNPVTVYSTAAGMASPVRVVVTAPDSRPALGVACLGGIWAMLTGPDATTGGGQSVLWDFTERNVVGLGGHLAVMGGGAMTWDIAFRGSFAWVATGLSINPSGLPPSPDAGADANPDVSPDAQLDVGPPDELAAAPDLTPADAGVEAGTDAEQTADAATDEGGADAGESSADAEVDATADDRSGRSPVDGDPGGTTVHDVNLRVGCACRLGGGSGPAGFWLLLPLALLFARRRR